MPRFWFVNSVRYVSPIALAILFVWNLYDLFVNKGGHYGYALWAEVLGGWLISALVFAAGFIIRLVVKQKKKKGFEETEIVWIEDDEV